MTITQWHVPVDDENCYWYAIFTSYATPVDKKKMRDQRLELYELPDYRSRKNKSNDYGFDPQEQATETFTGMGADINVHDQWAVESMGAIQNRTREHLGTADKAIVQYRGCCGRKSRRSLPAQSRSCSSTPRMPAASRARPPWTASGRRGDGKPSGWRSTSSGGAARHGGAGACRDRGQGAASQGGLVMASLRHCERSEAIHGAAERKHGLLRRFAPRNDDQHNSN